jgi:hypothetical protein
VLVVLGVFPFREEILLSIAFSVEFSTPDKVNNSNKTSKDKDFEMKMRPPSQFDFQFRL